MRTNAARRIPSGRKGRISQHHPWFFGVRFVLLMAAWDGYRMPIGLSADFAQGCHADYRSENVLFREMVSGLCPPKWAKLIIVGGDAAYGSKANMDMVKARAKTDTALAGALSLQSLGPGRPLRRNQSKHLVTHVPHKYYQCTRVPRAHGRKGRKTFWTYAPACVCVMSVTSLWC